MKRTGTVVIGLVIVLAATTVGWIAGSSIKSPAQVAAEAEPPEPSLITAPVELRAISNKIITRGDVRFADPEVVAAPVLALDGFTPIVTAVPAQGELLSAGDILVEISGRPTFLLEGDIQLFRTVQLGDSGVDIEQLQVALANIGISPGEVDGVFGPATASAVETLYESHGYESFPPSDEDLATWSAAQDALDNAISHLESATKFRDEVFEAHGQLEDAESEVADAEASLATAGQRLETAESGVHPDTGLPPTSEELQQLQQAVDEAEGRLEQTEEALDGARVRVSELGPAPSLAEENRAVRQASEAVEAARKLIGVRVPQGEVFFATPLPVRVIAVPLQRGDTAEGDLMTVSSSQLAIDAAVPVQEAVFVETGMRVTIEPSGLSPLEGTIARIAPRPGTDGAEDDEVHIEIRLNQEQADLNEANVKITIDIQTRSTEGEVLVVPVAALWSRGNEETLVTVVTDSGTTHDVIVTTGLSDGVFVEVDSVDGELQAGDSVVVGR